MASAQLSQFSHMFSIPAIPETPTTTTVYPISIPLYSNKINNSNTSQVTGTRKESKYLEVRNETIENDSSSNSSRVLPRVVFSAHFSPKRALSPSEFSSSPASYSSAEEDFIASEQDAITTLASLAVVARKIHPSPAFSSVASSAVSSPPSSPCPASPRRSARKPKPSSRSKEQILGKRRFSGPATRLRKHKSVITEDDEKEEYYRDRAAPIPALEASYTKTRRIPIPIIAGDGVIGCGGYKFIPPSNSNYPIPPKKNEILSMWSSIQRKLFLASYLEYGKDFAVIGKQVNKSTVQVVEFYYLIKHSPEFRKAKAMKKELELYEEDLNKVDAQIKNLAKLAYGKKGGRKKKTARN
ncbi:351_t:CDS:1 [Funneliformis caledonium]|uniref:351_t:CDS:1 n=2 Tax=Funneliformis TaxID=1117308 RepID=A0A9N9ESI7_9GLOM|nr:10462_t:CDS:1 [Funneliformis mosseae]CAG8687728.1 351_t:CDS:1 [Funneliformis caledonium]